MKVQIDIDRCQGHGVCAATSDLFDLGPDGKAHTTREPAGPADTDGARSSEASCPELAITLQDS